MILGDKVATLLLGTLCPIVFDGCRVMITLSADDIESLEEVKFVFDRPEPTPDFAP